MAGWHAPLGQSQPQLAAADPCRSRAAAARARLALALGCRTFRSMYRKLSGELSSSVLYHLKGTVPCARVPGGGKAEAAAAAAAALCLPFLDAIMAAAAAVAVRLRLPAPNLCRGAFTDGTAAAAAVAADGSAAATELAAAAASACDPVACVPFACERRFRLAFVRLRVGSLAAESSSPSATAHPASWHSSDAAAPIITLNDEADDGSATAAAAVSAPASVCCSALAASLAVAVSRGSSSGLAMMVAAARWSMAEAGRAAADGRRLSVASQRVG